ncbi:2-C-methyl-D-erythritol 4-phosphate cytidylyltransferase [Antricoccus suffuscus]|uniref:2-C-methyl-D-erythritol 4-phosphate cytidylyltransferase n=2 Tax=Antricoccus suffuscus TaxID=1629062 RepID=A0A2T1A3Z7_9ACTN|nr:2-C-methyl-D-erythritol 4-phosphate cytidylyltransferase [Antricoccus suffuscus]
MGAQRNKVLHDLHGRPIIAWAIEAFAGHPDIDEVVVIGNRDDLADLRLVAQKVDESIAVIEGGAERPDSERAALEHLRTRIESGTIGLVAIHDGARPLVDHHLINRVIHAVGGKNGIVGAIPVLASPPLIQLADDDVRTLGHLSLVRAQTPQAFDARLLLRAYDEARREGFVGTDTSSYVERVCGDDEKIVGVLGDDRNLKVTFKDDLARANALAIDQK